MKLRDLFENVVRPKPTDVEILKFFSYYSDVATMSDDDIGVLYNEEFSDCYSDEEIGKGELDNDIQKAIVIVHNYRK